MSSNLIDKIASNYAAKYRNDPDDGEISIDTQDSKYSTKLPSGSVASNGRISLELKLKHHRGAGQDDKATITVEYNSDGSFHGTPQIKMEDGGDSQIPDWVSTGLDIVGDICVGVEEVAGLFLAPETAGVDEIVVQEVAAETKEITEYAQKAIEIYNDIAHLVCKLSDDGGRLYFSAVVNQALNALNSSVKEAIHNKTYSRRINFKHDLFDSAVPHSSSDKNGGAVQYHFDNDYYRTWYPDEGVVYANAGILLSCKIDGIRDENKDDHVALLAIYDAGGNLFAAQAVIEMKNETTITSGLVTYNKAGQVIQSTKDGGTKVISDKKSVHSAIDDLLRTAMKNGTKHYNDYSGARKRLPDVVQDNLQWMGESIVLGDAAK